MPANPVSGVYTLTVFATGQQYVGGTTDLKRRWRQHKSDLARGCHKSRTLQIAYEDGAAIVFAQLCTCRPEDVTLYEQRAMDVLQPTLNSAPQAVSSRGFRMTPEQREGLKLRPQSVPKQRHEVNGELLSVPELASKYGLGVGTIRARLRRGLTGSALVDAVISEPLPTFTVHGEALTRDEIARKYGLPLTTIYTRITAGWTGDALALPRTHRGKNSA